MNPPSLSLRVWRDVDILILGASVTAVSAALAASAAGRRVAVLSDEPYFGLDLAGTFQLWKGATPDPLLAGAFASCSEDPARPAALKRHLERTLIQAGVPFLFSARPVGLLRDDEGNIRGIAAAARTSLLAVTCRQVIDATPFGLAARLAGLPIVPRRDHPEPIRWRVLSSQRPSTWPGACRPLTPSYRQQQTEGEKIYPAFELEIAREKLSPDDRALEHMARSYLVDEAVWLAADHLLDAGSGELPSQTPAASLADVADHLLQPTPGLWMANTLLSLANPAEFLAPDAMSSLGRRIGTLAAATAPPRNHQPEDLLRFQAGGAKPDHFSFTKTFLRSKAGTLTVHLPEFPVWEDFDVVVAGGGTGGAPAAIAAARSGARSLCVETAHGLGGVGTLGAISSYWFGNKCGFTAELNDLVSEVDSHSRAKKGNAWHPGTKSGMYHRLLRQAGGTAWLDSFVFGVRMAGNRPDGVLISTPHGCGFVPAKTFVDATGNADVAAAAGARCRVMGADHAAVQGTGISPRVHPAVGYQNSDHTFIEENDPEGITCAHLQAREKYPNDFETLPFVNSRERRQILGEYEVSPLDILAGRAFPDTIFTARSNFDTHGFIIHPVFMVVPPDHKPLQAHVPLRCMIPSGVEGILVTGLGMSAHRDALPVIRMQADVQNQGYAAGLLAARTAQSGMEFRDVDVRAFQKELAEVGIISASTAADVDSFPLDPSVITAAARGALDQPKEVAILFANPDACRSDLLTVMSESPDPDLRRKAALILGLMGRKEAAGFLCSAIAKADWDEGWDYRGMGQFGASMSPLDAMIIALGRTKDPEADPILACLCDRLDGGAAFSHCRALALAAATLREPELTAALGRLLDHPGFTGHTFQSVEDMLDDADGDPITNTSRNLSLREIYVARGLFLSGDPAGRGREILEAYASDLRGHFSLHAQAVLAGESRDVQSGDLA